MLVPGVGVREGILLDLVRRSTPAEWRRTKKRGARTNCCPARDGSRGASDTTNRTPSKWRAWRFRSSTNCARCMKWERTCGWFWKWARCCTTSGYYVHRKSHHRHGEYLVRNGEIPGIGGWRQDMVASLVRYHNSKSEPALGHQSYVALDGARRRQVRLLSSLLRIAEKLESEHAQRVAGVDVHIAGRRAIFVIRATDGTRLDIAGLERKAELFEKRIPLAPEFRRAQKRAKVA